MSLSQLQEPVLFGVIGPETIIVIGVIVVLFGGSQLPKLARSLGLAKHEFEKGQKQSEADAKVTDSVEPANRPDDR